MKHPKFKEMMERYPRSVWGSSNPRRSREAEIALLLVLGGCAGCELSYSGFSGDPLATSTYMDHYNSLQAYPYIKYKDTNLLWAILKKAGVDYCGGAGNKHMQASWICNREVYNRYKPSIPLIVANFWSLKQLVDDKKIVIDY